MPAISFSYRLPTTELHKTSFRIDNDDKNRGLGNTVVTYVIDDTGDTSRYLGDSVAESQKDCVITSLPFLHCTSGSLCNKEHKHTG